MSTVRSWGDTAARPRPQGKRRNPSLADELVAVKLERLGRSTRDVYNPVYNLGAKGAASTALEPSFLREADPCDRAGDGRRDGAQVDPQAPAGEDRGRKAKGIYRGRKPALLLAKVCEMCDAGQGPTAIAKALEISRRSVLVGLLVSPGLLANVGVRLGGRHLVCPKRRC